MGKDFHVNIYQMKAGVVILISYKVDFRAMKIPKIREVHYTMMRASINKENTAILNVCTKHKSCKICKVKTDRTERQKRPSTIIFGYFTIPLLTTD